jgi:hypothetical protein
MLWASENVKMPQVEAIDLGDRFQADKLMARTSALSR